MSIHTRRQRHRDSLNNRTGIGISLCTSATVNPNYGPNTMATAAVLSIQVKIRVFKTKIRFLLK